MTNTLNKIANSIKIHVKRSPYLLRLAKPVYKFFVNQSRKLGLYRAPRMLQGELNFFSAIYKQCKVVVDVGARYDTDYIEISGGNGIDYYLFEINPKFYARLNKNLRKFNENVYAENVAVGERDGFTEYFEDSESVLRSTTAVKNSTMRLGSNIEMIRLDHYLTKKHITQVDFLKTDIEEYDYFALVGCGEFLSMCRYIQFELGIGAPINDVVVTNEHYYTLLSKNFDLYILADENNPLWYDGAIESDLVILDYSAKIAIEKAQKQGVGFNIVGVNRMLETNLSGLSIASLNRQQP